MANKRVEVEYSGNVQGVGFRFTAEEAASSYQVKGYVRNLANGGVELVAEGEEAKLKDYLDFIRREFDHRIDNISAQWLPPTGELKRFEIRF